MRSFSSLDVNNSLDEIEALARDQALLSKSGEPISHWSVTQHLNHLLKVDEGVLKGILSGKFKPQPRGINILGRISLFLGYIPRGRGKAPDITMGENVSPEELGGQITVVRELFSQLEERKELLTSTVPIFRHPYFSGLTPCQTLRFLEIHHRHHLKICSEIQKCPGIAP